MSLPARACPRCGDFAGTFAGPLCERCVVPGAARRVAAFGKYPPGIRVALLVPALAAAFVLGLGAYLSIRSPFVDVWPATLVRSLACIAIAFFVEEIYFPWTLPRLRTAILAEHGVSPEGLSVYVKLEDKLRTLDAGVLSVRADGLVFAGAFGTRLSFPFERVARAWVGVARPWALWTVGARIALEDGAVLHFVAVEGTFVLRGRARALVQAIEERKRVSAPPT